MPTTSQRVKSASINPKVVSNAYAVLEKLPAKPKERFSLREAVTEIRQQIQDALAKGYSYQEVADMLAKQGINISASTLKNYVPSGKRQAKATVTKGKKRGRPAAVKAVVEDEPAPKRGRRPKAAPEPEPTIAPAKRGPKPGAKAAAAKAAPRTTRRKKSI